MPGTKRYQPMMPGRAIVTGHGRQGRPWVAPRGTSLLASWVFRPLPSDPALFALLSGVEPRTAWLLGVLWVLPLLYAFWTAFHSPEFSTRLSLTAPLTLANFVTAWHAAPFARYFLNTLLLVFMVLVLNWWMLFTWHDYQGWTFEAADASFELLLAALLGGVGTPFGAVLGGGLHPGRLGGAAVVAIQKLAGHKDLKTTMRYMHLSPAAVEGAIRLLDASRTGTPRLVLTCAEIRRMCPSMTARNR